MDKQHAPMSEKKKLFLLKTSFIFMAFVVIAFFVIIILFSKKDSTLSGEVSASETTTPVEKLTDSINIPGYSSLTFVSGETEQNMSFSNPEVNFCWFRISLVLEDGRTLFTSNLFGPGELSEPIVLNFPLEKGEYERTTILYECFADEAGAIALNGAETTLTIFVE